MITTPLARNDGLIIDGLKITVVRVTHDRKVKLEITRADGTEVQVVKPKEQLASSTQRAEGG